MILYQRVNLMKHMKVHIQGSDPTAGIKRHLTLMIHGRRVVEKNDSSKTQRDCSHL